MTNKGGYNGKTDKPPLNRKLVTSYDVAEAAGVSQSAVSRVFSERGYASPAMRERVHEAAQKLGFRPNAIARSLITRRSQIVAVVIADLQYSFYLSILHRLCHELRSGGYQALLFSVPSSEDIDDFMPDVMAYQVDGVILASSRLSSRSARLCRDAGVPVVLINRYLSDSAFSAISADNLYAGRLAADFLLAGGHERPAFISGLEDTSTSVDRERGFFERVKRLGGRRPLRRKGFFTYDGGYAAALDLMRLGRRPDAIFCASDIMAMGAMDAIRYEAGLRVPEDVSIVGFNNAAEAAWKGFELTTITSSTEEMSRRAVGMLEELLENPELEPTREFIKGRLVIRKSARLPADPAFFRNEQYTPDEELK